VPKKTEEQRAEARRQAETRRRPDAEKAAHFSARGKRVMSVAKLTREQVTEEDVRLLRPYLDQESDRGLAIVASAMTEHGLFWSIYRRMPDLGEEMKRAVFEGRGAPLSSFSAKIVMGRALGIYGPDTERALNQIREVRNAFAHALKPIDFSHKAIEQACRSLAVPAELESRAQRSARERFYLVNNYLSALLMQDALAQKGRTFSITLP
jgi:hypothetical protein